MNVHVHSLSVRAAAAGFKSRGQGLGVRGQQNNWLQLVIERCQTLTIDTANTTGP
jgi:hypothetical protein